MMLTPTRCRSVADHQAYYKKVAPRVDTHWRSGTPRLRKEVLKPKTKRRNTDSEIQTTFILKHSIEKVEAIDEVFKESHPEDIEDISSVIHSATASSNKTISQHFRQLFVQLEAYMETASADDCIAINQKMNDIRDLMTSINDKFEELLQAGRQLEAFLKKRTNSDSTFNY